VKAFRGQRARLDDAAFRRVVDDLKDSIRLSSVIGRRVKLQRSGHEWKGLCPFHQERTPSFTVVDAAGFYHCFGCGSHGDAIRFVQETEGVGFREAYRMITDADFPAFTPQELGKERAEFRLVNLANEEAARRFWKEASPIRGGDPAHTYLAARSITADPPPCLRFGHVPAWQDKETKEWGPKRPALLCAAEDGTGAVVGIQRIFFERDDPSLGRADKKRSLGSIKGSAMRLGPVAETIIFAEGPEDGLSIMQEGPGHPVWVPFGTSMMPAVQLPPGVCKIIIAGQNNTAGRVAANKAAIAIFDQGIDVELAWPAHTFDDWNDQLRGAR
jgi:DNA primase